LKVVEFMTGVLVMKLLIQFVHIDDE